MRKIITRENATLPPRISCSVLLGLVVLGVPLLLLGFFLLGIRKQPPDFRELEPVEAAGHLVLLQRASGDRAADQRMIARVLEEVNAAPVAAVAQDSWWSSPSFLSELAPDADTPPLPPAPTTVTRYGTIHGLEYRLRMGSVALRVSGSFAPTDAPLDPVVLTVNYHTGRRTTQLTRIIMEKGSPDLIDGAAYAHGMGVLIILSGRYGAFANGSAGRMFVYRAQEPLWIPLLVFRSPPEASEVLKVGQTADGTVVYVSGRGDMFPQRLWQISNTLKTVREVILRGSLEATSVIPSPQADLLAVGSSSLAGRGVKVPLQIVTLNDGRVYRATSRRGGDYIDTAVAWSADVPNRIYFTDVFLNLYMLDLDLGAERSDEQGL